jgi:hypothetical protein
VPTRLVRTLKLPSDVEIGIHRTPPESRSVRFELSKYLSSAQGAEASCALFVKSLPLLAASIYCKALGNTFASDRTGAALLAAPILDRHRALYQPLPTSHLQD